MNRHPHLSPLASALVAAFLLGAAAPVLAARSPGVAGVVLASDGKVVAHAKVCIDRNGNARCDANEASVFSGADGQFKLSGSGIVVAEVGKGAFVVDEAAKAKVAVTRAFVLRAPDGDAGEPRSVGPLSTELQAMIDAAGKPASAADAAKLLRARLGLADGDASGAIDSLAVADPGERAVLVAEQGAVMERLVSAVADTGRKDDLAAALASRLALERIANVVVIYAENRSFNNLFAGFPGATGVTAAANQKKKGVASYPTQKDRDGSVLAKLPPAWGGLTAAGQPLTVTQAQTTNVWPNAPFQVDSATPAWGAPALTNAIVTRDLYHRFYENQMQIDGGLNDKFAAWGDAGGLVMGVLRRQPHGHVEGGARVHRGRPLLPGRVRRLLPQPPVPGMRLRAGVPGRRHQPGPSLDHDPAHRRRRQVHARARAGRQLAGFGAGRPAGVQEERQPHPEGLLR